MTSERNKKGCVAKTLPAKIIPEATVRLRYLPNPNSRVFFSYDNLSRDPARENGSNHVQCACPWKLVLMGKL